MDEDRKPGEETPFTGTGPGMEETEENGDISSPGADRPGDSGFVVPPIFTRNPGTEVQLAPVGLQEAADPASPFVQGEGAFAEEPREPDAEPLLPRAPRNLAEVGLSKAFLTDLTLKIIHYSGTPSLAQLQRRLGLGPATVQQIVSTLTEERLIEVMSQSDLYTGNYRYRLTERGGRRVMEALDRTRYAGPAPVTAEQYTEVMRRLQAQKPETSRSSIKNVLSELVLAPEVADGVARALYSNKAGILYGPSGNGKTSILERFARSLDGVALIPYSIYAYGQPIRVFDPSVHEQVEEPAAGNMIKDETRLDRRWVLVRRPAIVLGAEIGRESLDLAYDPAAKFYQAPPHIKAQGGVLVIDDFGRQRIEARDLLTRWLIALERGWDTLSLATGEKLVVPFSIQLLFSTNLRIKDLADDALLRRILYKVEIPDPRPEDFTEILRRLCRQHRVLVADGVIDHVVQKLYESGARPHASYGRDLLEMIVESASFDGRDPVLDRESFDRVFDLFLAREATTEDD